MCDEHGLRVVTTRYDSGLQPFKPHRKTRLELLAGAGSDATRKRGCLMHIPQSLCVCLEGGDRFGCYGKMKLCGGLSSAAGIRLRNEC
jgi:hypothetical protein